MNEFEKWRENWVCDIPVCSSMECNDCKVLLKQGWKAACEYWLQLAKDHDQEMQFMIEDELGEY